MRASHCHAGAHMIAKQLYIHHHSFATPLSIGRRFIEEKLTSTLLDGVRHVAIDGAYAYVISKVAATMTIVDVC